MSEFGDYIKRVRESKNMTLNQVAMYSEISAAQLSRIETGKRGTPKPSTIEKLAQALKIDYNELMKVAGYIDRSTSLLEINNKFIAPIDEVKAILTTREFENKILPDEKKLLDDIRSSESRDELVEVEILQRVNTFLSKEKDIANRLLHFKRDIENSNGLAFDGEPMSEEAKESLIESMEHIFRQTQRINKKYTPKKYREDE